MSLSFDATADELKLFLEEGEEQLQLLDEDLIKLENDNQNADLLQEIFRAAHTLKGSSATIGHQRMAELTHAMESVLDKLRKGTFEVSTAIIDTLLESLDALRVLLREVETLEESGLEVSELVAKLSDVRISRGCDEEPTGPSEGELVLNEYQRTVLLGAKADGKHAYILDVLIDDKSPLIAARHFQVLIELSAVGEVLKSIPSMEEIEAEQVRPQLMLILTTSEDTDAVKAVMANICDIVSLDIRPYEEKQSSLAAAADVEEQVARPADAGTASAAKGTKTLAKATKTVRIDVERLDNLMNLVGELVIERTRLQQIGASLEMTSKDEQAVGNLVEASQRVGRITNELQDEIMKSRMLPIENVFSKFPRVMRDLSLKSGKQVNFVVEGQETELDRSVIEEIGDPLIHLLRNAIDHGIELPDERAQAGKPETGTIRLAAFHQENHIVIVVEDDGRGINPADVKESAVRKGVISAEVAERMDDMQAVELIFQPGFSTAKVVSDVSGRGVGMDIVKTNVEKLNGFITIQSKPGHGTKFTITLPLTLAIIQALLVAVGKRTCAIPLVSVLETLRVDQQEVKMVNGRETIILRDTVLPLIRLTRVFREAESGTSGMLMVVAAKFGDKQIGCVVDGLVGQQEIVIKPLGNLLGDIKGISGATILGDGRVALIIDVPALVRELLREQSGGTSVDRMLLAS